MNVLKEQRILMVDDEYLSIEPLFLILEHQGAIMTHVSRLEAALERLREETFDYVLIDMRFNNGLPQELEAYTTEPNRYMQRGAALAKWLDDPANKLCHHPYAFYTAFPKQVPNGAVVFDKVGPGLKETLAAIQQWIEQEEKQKAAAPSADHSHALHENGTEDALGSFHESGTGLGLVHWIRTRFKVRTNSKHGSDPRLQDVERIGSDVHAVYGNNPAR